MCFSATASFGSGIVLTAVGVATLVKVKSPAQWAFASIPLLFGVQQVAEGCVWLTMNNSDYLDWQQSAIHGFLFFAHIVWPFWIPFSMLLLEKHKVRRKILSAMLALAGLLSLSEIYCMTVYPTVAIVNRQHIDYTVAFPVWYARTTEWIYGIVCLLPCFISTVKRMWVFGYCLTLTLVMSAIFYKFWVVSVWCFFAAISSVAIFFLVSDINKRNRLNKNAVHIVE